MQAMSDSNERQRMAAPKQSSAPSSRSWLIGSAGRGYCGFAITPQAIRGGALAETCVATA
jgi:hypothetical protein